MNTAYLETISLIERLHRQCLEVVKAELDRIGVRDLNNVQALILFNIGDEELTVGELTQRGYYLGSNVSYNVKKMVENGYLIQERSPHDRRSFHVHAAQKGRDISTRLGALLDAHAQRLTDLGFTEDAINQANTTLRRLEQFWSVPQLHGGRLSPAA